MIRNGRTLCLYAAMGCLGYALAGLGAILPELRLQHDLPRSEAALYPSGFALGLVLVGLVGDRVARWLGRHAASAAMAVLASGTTLLALGGDRIVTGLGAIALGLGGAGLVYVVPAELRLRHGDDTRVSIGEANATASAASVLAPVMVGAAIGTSLGWQAAFLALPALGAIPVIAVLHWTRHSPRLAAPNRPNTGPADNRGPRRFWWWWFTILIAVAVEFCVLLWAADFLRTETEMAAGPATTASVGFVLGMAIGRFLTAPLLRVSAAKTVRLLTAQSAVAATGLILFWASPTPVVALAALIITGLGVALLYPLALSEALAAWPSQPIRAASRCALASGAAIGSAPLLLATLADTTELRTAFLVAPALTAILLIRLIAAGHRHASDTPKIKARTDAPES